MQPAVRQVVLFKRPSAVPVNVSLPVISGTAVAGTAHSTSNGTWTNNPVSSYAYQWKADAVDIGGATSANYTPTEVQVGTTLTVAVTPTNAAGAGSAATSAGVGPVTSNVTVPVLTKTTGTGVNPMRWTSVIVANVGTDYICMRYRKDAGSWTEETPVLFDSNFVLDYGIDGVNYPWPTYTADTFGGGVVVDVQEGVKRDGVTYWSSSITETMASSNVAYTHGGKATSAGSSTSVSFTTLPFTAGRALLVLTCYSNAGGSTDSVPTALTITPTGGGGGINCTKLGSGGRAASRAAAIYISDSDVTATNYDVTGTRPNAARSNTLMYGALANANATPTAGPTFTAPASETNPHATSSLTCPSGGLIVGFVIPENSLTWVATNANTTLIDQNFFNSEFGLVLGTRITTGTISFDVSGSNPTVTYGRGVVAFDNV